MNRANGSEEPTAIEALRDIARRAGCTEEVAQWVHDYGLQIGASEMVSLEEAKKPHVMNLSIDMVRHAFALMCRPLGLVRSDKWQTGTRVSIRQTLVGLHLTKEQVEKAKTMRDATNNKTTVARQKAYETVVQAFGGGE